MQMQQRRSVASNLSAMFKKQTCVCNIVMDGDKILLLKRAQHDSFHGGTWCLPGGGVDLVENKRNACIRETYEECGLQSGKDYFLMGEPVEADLKEVTIVYYYSSINKGSQTSIRLNEREHEQYVWATPQEWLDMDLILDLKNHLATLFNTGHE